MKFCNKFIAIIMCIILAFGALPISSFAAESDKINVVPAYPKKAYVEISKMGILNTYGAKFEDLSERFVFNFSKNPLDIASAEQLEFDIFISDYSKFKSTFSNKVLSINLSSNSSNKFSNRVNYAFFDQVTATGWNHVAIPLKNGSADLKNITFVYLASSGGTAKNPLSETNLKIANVCGVTGVSKYYIPNLTVGQDETEVIVTWIDNSNTNGKVVLSANGGKVGEFEATKRQTDLDCCSNYATVTGLEANTKYTYYIESGTFKSDEYTFETKDFDDDFSFVQVSDIQLNGNTTNFNNWKKTLSRINENFPDTSFIVNTGDVSDSSTSHDCYISYKSPDLMKKYIMGVVPGNHDGSYYSLYFTSPNTYKIFNGFEDNQYDYWYGYNNVLFISLNSLISSIDYHKTFVKEVVKAQGHKYDWIIVNCHFSMFSASYHSKESNVTTQRNALAPLFSELGVDLVISGHDHVYDRSYMMNGKTPKVSDKDYAFNNDNDVLYISATTGSALKYNPAVSECEEYSAKTVENKYGFINYDVCEDAITLTFYNTADMSVLDEFTLYKEADEHKVVKDAELLETELIKDATFNSNGEYDLAFDIAKDLSDTCTMELDVFATSDVGSISVSLKDGEGDYIQKSFEDLKTGWNHLAINLKEANANGDVDFGNITNLSLIGTPYASVTIANGYLGHIYDNACDKTCNSCDAERTIKHTYKSTTTKATLEKDGRFENKCTSCGYVASTSYDIPKISSVKLSATSYTYDGKVKSPSVTVKDSAGKTLKKDTDYTVSYASGRKTVGTYKVTVTFKGKYSGTKPLTFKINPITISSKFKFTLSTTSYTYDGKVKSPSVTVKNHNGTKLTKNTHYTVTYASGRKNVGTYKVTIKMKGNYSGTKTLTFKINPVKTTVSKLTAGKKSIKVYVTKKSTQVTGYQIYCSTSKSFSSKVTKKYITSYKTTSTTLSGLSAKKTYYVKVRTYKTVNGTKYYSGWSTYKYTKTK